MDFRLQTIDAPLIRWMREHWRTQAGGC